jgi:hypothetical protein
MVRVFRLVPVLSLAALVVLAAFAPVSCSAFTANDDGAGTDGGNAGVDASDAGSVAADGGPVQTDAAEPNADAAGPCVTGSQTDALNCGACGVSCSVGAHPGTCVGGICQPVAIASGGTPQWVRALSGGVYWTDTMANVVSGLEGAKPFTMTISSQTPTGLALTAKDVGIIGAGVGAGSTGATITARAANASLGSPMNVLPVTGIAAAGTSFYVGSGTTLDTCGASVPCVATGADAISTISMLASDGVTLAYAAGGQIYFLPVATLVASGHVALPAGTVDLAMAGTNAYVATSVGLMILPETGSGKLAVADVSTTAVAVTATYVYFVGKNSAGGGVVGRAKLDGSGEEKFGYGPGTPAGIAVDGDYIYYADQKSGTAGVYGARVPK